jgi:hypothetical protein
MNGMVPGLEGTLKLLNFEFKHASWQIAHFSAPTALLTGNFLAASSQWQCH